MRRRLSGAGELLLGSDYGAERYAVGVAAQLSCGTVYLCTVM